MAIYEVKYDRINKGGIISTSGVKAKAGFVKWQDLIRADSKADAIKKMRAKAPKGSKDFTAKLR